MTATAVAQVIDINGGFETDCCWLVGGGATKTRVTGGQQRSGDWALQFSGGINGYLYQTVFRSSTTFDEGFTWEFWIKGSGVFCYRADWFNGPIYQDTGIIAGPLTAEYQHVSITFTVPAGFREIRMMIWDLGNTMIVDDMALSSKFFVDDDAPGDPGPGDPNVSDPCENGTAAHPFDTIQKAISTARDGDVIMVHPGLYLNPLADDHITLTGENITLTSIDPTDWNVVESTVIRGCVEFAGTEDENCLFTGFSIKAPNNGAVYGNGTGAAISYCRISGNSPSGGIVLMDYNGTIHNCLIVDNSYCVICGPLISVIYNCSGLMENCTIANNASGINILDEKSMTLKNCIIYNNGGAQIMLESGSALDITYCDLQGGLGGITGGGTVNWGPGNIDADPYFVDAVNQDYHLRSERGRYRAATDEWILDHVTSPCIDSGDPYREPENEPMPNGGRINIGAYGGTGQAGMSEWALKADFNLDGIVNLEDFTVFVESWLQKEEWVY